MRAEQSKEYSLDQVPEADGIRRQILNAAARLLRHRGYEATTTRAIADAVGIKAGSIYHHFASKDDIVKTVINEGVRVVHDAVVKSLEALPENTSPRELLETAIKAHLVSSLECSDYTSASIRAYAFLPEELRAECRTARRDYENVWRTILAAIIGAGAVDREISPDAFRLMLLGAINWAGEWYRPGRLSIEKISRDFAAIVIPERRYS